MESVSTDHAASEVNNEDRPAHTLGTATEHNRNFQIPVERCNAIHVAIRLVFLRIGEVDIQKEKFSAHITMEAQWCVNRFDGLTPDDQTRLNNGEIIKLPENFPENHWYPRLFLLNVVEGAQVKIEYSLTKIPSSSQIQIREFRDVKGSFYSKFNLHHFPTDIQKLSIFIRSALYDTQVTLKVDPHRPSTINPEAFVDYQQWELYDHIETQTRVFQTNGKHPFLRGRLFKNDGNGPQSILTIACYASRRTKSFFWKGYCLIFLITILAFCSFALPASGILSRLAIICTLILTSVAFRWTVTDGLPKISYLTAMDFYVIASIFFFLALCIWYSIIVTLVYIDKFYYGLDLTSKWKRLDRKVLIGLIFIYSVVHLIMGIGQYIVYILRRRSMKKRCRDYRRLVKENPTQIVLN